MTRDRSRILTVHPFILVRIVRARGIRSARAIGAAGSSDSAIGAGSDDDLPADLGRSRGQVRGILEGSSPGRAVQQRPVKLK